MTTDKKYRVICVKDFVGTARSSEPIENNITYLYVDTLEEARELVKGLTKSGVYQSDTGVGRDITINMGSISVTMPNPNLAAIEL